MQPSNAVKVNMDILFGVDELFSNSMFLVVPEFVALMALGSGTDVDKPAAIAIVLKCFVLLMFLFDFCVVFFGKLTFGVNIVLFEMLSIWKVDNFGKLELSLGIWEEDISKTPEVEAIFVVSVDNFSLDSVLFSRPEL